MVAGVVLLTGISYANIYIPRIKCIRSFLYANIGLQVKADLIKVAIIIVVFYQIGCQANSYTSQSNID